MARTRGVTIGQRLERKTGALDQTRRMPEPRVFDLEFKPFIPGKRQGIEFADLPFELFALALQCLGASRGRPQRLLRFAPGPVGSRNLQRQFGQPGMGVEQRPLGLSAQKRLMGVLTVDIDQELADLTQLLGGCRRTVDVAARAAAGIEHATQQQFVIGFEVVGCQPGDYLRQAADLEGGRHFGPVATGADDAGIGTIAQGQRQRVDQDRLAGPGFPGQCAKTG